MLTMAPPAPRSRMTFRARRVTMNGPVRLTSRTWRQVSVGISYSEASMLMPLLLTTISSRPYLSATPLMTSSMRASSRTSSGTPVTSWPVSSAISAATLAVRSGCWSLRTTVAPSRAKVLATACPIPAPAAAVTKTTLSENSIICSRHCRRLKSARLKSALLAGSGDELPRPGRAGHGVRAQPLSPPGGRSVTGLPFPQPASESLQWVLHRHADGPVDLMRQPGAQHRRLPGQRAGRADQREIKRGIIVLTERGLGRVDHHGHPLRVGGQPGQVRLHRLEPGDRLPELHA